MEWQSSEAMLPPLIALVSTIVLLVALRSFMPRSRTPPSLNWCFSVSENLLGLHSGRGLAQLQTCKYPTQEFTYLSFKENNYVPLPLLMSLKLDNLRRLDLSNSRIESVEGLGCLLAPRLQVLSLANNYITSLKVLRRVNFPNLIWLELYNNPIMGSLQRLSEVNFPALNYLWLEFFQTDPNYFISLNWIAKSQSSHFSKLHIRSDAKIMQNNVIQALKRKHPGIDIRI